MPVASMVASVMGNSVECGAYVHHILHMTYLLILL